MTGTRDVAFQPDYVPGERPSDVVDGKTLIATPEEQQAFTFRTLVL